jgi:hypothetical protein
MPSLSFSPALTKWTSILGATAIAKAKANVNTTSIADSLPISPERQSIVALPGMATTGCGLGVTMALAETARFLAR